MLKIAEYNTITGEKIELKELEKYGFKRKYYNGTKNLVLEYEIKNLPHKYQDIIFDIPTRKLEFCNWGSDIMFDLIKDGIVEKVEE